MLPGPDEVKEVYLNATTGILAGAKGSSRDKLLIECGTIDPDVIIEVANETQKAGVGVFVDAPV